MPEAGSMQRDNARISSELFGAYLKCPTKCFLLAAGEPKADNAYSAWAAERNRAYRVAGIKKLAAQFDPREIMSGAPLDVSWASRKSGLAINTPTRVNKLETVIHAVEWIADKQNSNSGTSLIPVRFVADNKLTHSDKLMLAFDAHVLANFLNQPVVAGHIVHRDDFKTHKVKTSEVEREVKKTVGKISALLSGSDPPKLALNRHCPECAYQERCRKLAAEKDDLSLLVGLSDKERAKLNGKGIFSVTQFSYTFRPRRRSKRQAGRPEKYHHALKALAIREKKIHVVGTPQLKIEGTPVFLDVEGLPDRDFYYLVGLRWPTANGVEQRNFWADASVDEARLWADFLAALSTIASPTIVHYGSFETAFLKKMSDRYCAPPEGSVAASAIVSAVNLLSFIFARIYFPTYSNGLKDIARYLDFKWNDPGASGLQSIAWRHEWERLRDLALKERLIRYNVDDCEALEVVSNTITSLVKNVSESSKSAREIDIVYTEDLGKLLDTKWTKFKSSIAGLEQINDAAQWDYQRSRVYARPEPIKRPSPTNSDKSPRLKRQNYTDIVWIPPNDCPKCASKKRTKDRVILRHVQDILFGTTSLKQRFVKHVFQTYQCRTCGHVYGLDERYRAKAYKYGWNLLSYVIFHTVGLCMPQRTVHRSAQRLFGLTCPRTLINQSKARASNYYAPTKKSILERIVAGHLVHADETRANIKGKLAYVWVLTNLHEVAYILADSREGELIQRLLEDFKGVLVSDFYAAYDSIPCPQQKCLIHLMRDLNDDVLQNPFDEELKSIVTDFSKVLQAIIANIDRRGLKKYFLRKHAKGVARFYRMLDRASFKSEVALKTQKRLEKNRDKLFTFLQYDGVPWNNNNAEHAIKAFAKLRDIVSGSSTKKGIDEYLTLLSISQTCEYQKIDFLNFLRSGEKDLAIYAAKHNRLSLKMRDNVVVPE
ncbi:MAG: IS66 family transposase [Terracidiphilus sp.]